MSLELKVTGSKLHDEVQKRGEALEQDCKTVADAEKHFKHKSQNQQRTSNLTRH